MKNYGTLAFNLDVHARNGTEKILIKNTQIIYFYIWVIYAS